MKDGKLLADLSMLMWSACRQRGLKASVKLSNAAREGSLSRYLFCEGFTIRLSDHTHNNENNFDAQIIATSGDDFEAKRVEAMLVLDTLLGAALAA